MRKGLAVVCTMAAFGVAGAPAAANHSWGGYHWARTANPFTLQLGDNVTAAWDSYLAKASSDWSKSTVLDTGVVAGASAKKRCAATSGRVEVCNGTYGNNGWLGVATIWLTGGTHITQGTVKVNDTYFSQAAYNNPQERAHVMCQEVGHTFGLDHQSEDGSDLNTCMDYAAEPQANNTAPNQHDYDELAIIYKHLDSFTTVGTSSPSLAAKPHATPYKTVRKDSKKTSTITEYFADGSRRVTGIVWAR
jgi:hypothetical protein